MNKTLLALAVCGLAFSAGAKLPPLDAAAKDKAAEAAAKAAWQGKADAYAVCKVQDKIAAKYGKRDAAGKDPAKAGAQQTAAAKPPASSASAAASAAPGATTPVAAAAPPPCADPGPFAYNKPEEKPLETSGAHSPAGNATSPPSVRAESAQMVPGKTASAPKK